MNDFSEFIVVRQCLPAIEVRYITTGHKSTISRPRYNNNSDAVIVLQFIKTTLQFKQRGNVESVESLRSIYGQDPGSILTFNKYGIITHIFSYHATRAKV